MSRGDGASYELHVTTGQGQQGQRLGTVGPGGEFLACDLETGVTACGGEGGGVEGGGGGVPDNKSPTVRTKYLVSQDHSNLKGEQLRTNIFDAKEGRRKVGNGGVILYEVGMTSSPIIGDEVSRTKPI